MIPWHMSASSFAFPLHSSFVFFYGLSLRVLKNFAQQYRLYSKPKKKKKIIRCKKNSKVVICISSTDESIAVLRRATRESIPAKIA